MLQGAFARDETRVLRFIPDEQFGGHWNDDTVITSLWVQKMALRRSFLIVVMRLSSVALPHFAWDGA